ncbi:hypothetical protein FsymDg_3689 [Candidatus Protofrankia datiscae]|uniref:Uncharacterized protein n=1 Tax=Candidatus Protofrankia datiscae TaxID=2716812 RepID=F8B458_9ACTN|nr:hypothetical protein FsymDg_3689 [Candidatus Protofrankia datiscae]
MAYRLLRISICLPEAAIAMVRDAGADDGRGSSGCLGAPVPVIDVAVGDRPLAGDPRPAGVPRSVPRPVPR